MGLEGDVCTEIVRFCLVCHIDTCSHRRCIQCKVAQVLLQCSRNKEKLTAKATRNHLDDSDKTNYADSLKVNLCFYPADGIATTTA